MEKYPHLKVSVDKIYYVYYLPHHTTSMNHGPFLKHKRKTTMLYNGNVAEALLDIAEECDVKYGHLNRSENT